MRDPSPAIEPDAAVAGVAGPAACPEDDIACQERLHELGETLFVYEAGVEKAIGPAARDCWRGDVEAFHRSLNECRDLACRESALHDRLGSLHGMQTDRFRTRMALPEGPVLIAVLGPEDTVPPSEPAIPLVLEGDLVHADRDALHMGIAARRNGHDHVFVYDMEIGNQPGHDRLMGLVATSPTSRIRVTGVRHDTSEGIANFDTARCRFVLQLP